MLVLSDGFQVLLILHHHFIVMRKFNLCFLVAIFILISNPGISQTNPDRIIQASESKFNSLSDIGANVTYTLSNPSLPKPVVKTGTITLKKAKYKVVFPDEEMYCNGIYVWLYIKEDGETTKTDFDPEESISADKIFDIYKTESKSKYEGLEGTRHHITVFASDEGDDIWKTEVWIGETSNLIEKAVLWARNGSKYSYEMSSIKVNQGVTDAVFTYDEAAAKRAGIYINNLSEK